MMKSKNIQTILIVLLLVMIGGYAFYIMGAGPEVEKKNQVAVSTPKESISNLDPAEQLALSLCQAEISNEIVFHDSYSWSVEMTPDMLAPNLTAYCRFEYKSNPFTLIVAQYKSEEEVKNSIEDLLKKDGFLYLGVPSSLYKAKVSNDAKLYQAFISTDDCGMDGESYMDTGCPQGEVVFYQKNNSVIIVSERFEKELPSNKLSSRDVYQEIVK